MQDTSRPQEMLTTVEVAGILGIKVSTLETWRGRGQGPPWRRIGSRAIRYGRNDLAAWLDQQPNGNAHDKYMEGI